MSLLSINYLHSKALVVGGEQQNIPVTYGSHCFFFFLFVCFFPSRPVDAREIFTLGNLKLQVFKNKLDTSIFAALCGDFSTRRGCLCLLSALLIASPDIREFWRWDGLREELWAVCLLHTGTGHPCSAERPELVSHHEQSQQAGLASRFLHL